MSCRKQTLRGITGEELLSALVRLRENGNDRAILRTIQAYVPNELFDSYRSTMDSLFGPGSCCRLSLRSFGGINVSQMLAKS